jgi:hypothetical protein
MPNQNYLSDSLGQFRRLKSQAEQAIGQIDDAALFRQIDPDSNSIAVIMIHIAGNMHSRWTDFLTSDGEKPDRRRDTEFEVGAYDTRAQLLTRWESGWSTLFGAVKSLTATDCARSVMIRGESHTVVEAINRQMTHYAEHVGQIIYLARHFASSWQSLSIPKGQSEDFNQSMRDQSK